MTKTHFHQTACALCGSIKRSDYEILYPATYELSDVKSLFSARRLPDGIHSQIVRCVNDGLVRSTPVLENSILSKLYRESDFTYQTEVNNLITTYLNALQNVLPNINKTDNILEIGCGSGFVLSALKRKGYKKVFGAEPSKKAIALADKSLQKNIVPKLFSKSLFPGKKFSCIFILQTLDHVPNPEVFLKDCFAILKPGGYILSYHHNVASWSANFLGEKSPIFDIEHTYLYSHKTTKLIFEKSGFTVSRIYSPTNTLSFFHLLWLIPLPGTLKKILLKQSTEISSYLQRHNLPVPLGNTCIMAQKPF